MSKWVVDIHGDIEGDYEIIKKYEEPETDVLNKLRVEIEEMTPTYHNLDWSITDLVSLSDVLKLIDKYRTESENKE